MFHTSLWQAIILLTLQVCQTEAANIRHRKIRMEHVTLLSKGNSMVVLNEIIIQVRET